MSAPGRPVRAGALPDDSDGAWGAATKTVRSASRSDRRPLAGIDPANHMFSNDISEHCAQYSRGRILVMLLKSTKTFFEGRGNFSIPTVVLALGYWVLRGNTITRIDCDA